MWSTERTRSKSVILMGVLVPRLRVIRKRYRGPGTQRAQEGTWVGFSKSLTPSRPAQDRESHLMISHLPIKKKWLCSFNYKVNVSLLKLYRFSTALY